MYGASRDATLAISEYVPSPETVAAGRIWQSTGTVYFGVGEIGESWRFDVSLSIDNLMSRTKECSIFIERTK